MRISDWSSDVCSSDLAGGIERRSGWNRIIAGSVGRATVEAGAEIRLNPESRLLLASGNLFVDGSIEVRSGSIELRNGRGIPGGSVRVGEIGRASGRERGCQDV